MWLLELQDVPKGQQVFINLGQKTNFVLLNTYGFSDPDNHHDSLSVRLQLDEADPFLAAKERMLQRFGLKNDASATVTRLADTVTVPLDLLAFIRVKVRVCQLSTQLPTFPLRGSALARAWELARRGCSRLLSRQTDSTSPASLHESVCEHTPLA